MLVASLLTASPNILTGCSGRRILKLRASSIFKASCVSEVTVLDEELLRDDRHF